MSERTKRHLQYGRNAPKPKRWTARSLDLRAQARRALEECPKLPAVVVVCFYYCLVVSRWQHGQNNTQSLLDVNSYCLETHKTSSKQLCFYLLLCLFACLTLHYSFFVLVIKPVILCEIESAHDVINRMIIWLFVCVLVLLLIFL